jgi:hypothetical protein
MVESKLVAFLILSNDQEKDFKGMYVIKYIHNVYLIPPKSRAFVIARLAYQ